MIKSEFESLVKVRGEADWVLSGGAVEHVRVIGLSDESAFYQTWEVDEDGYADWGLFQSVGYSEIVSVISE